MAGTVSSYQQGAFATPVNGTTADATVVLSNDNATRGKFNSHDADATIHVQSSVLASRPGPGTAQRVWITTDGLRAYIDSGSAWNELAYLSLAAGGTVAGPVVLSSTLAVSGASTLAAVTATTGTFSSVLSSITGVFTSLNTSWSGSGVEVAYNGGRGSVQAVSRPGGTLSPIDITGDSIRLVPGGNTANALAVANSGAVTIAQGLTVSASGIAVTGGVHIINGGLAVDAGTTSLQNVTITPTLAAGTYGAQVLGAAGAARDIFMAGQNGVSNGFTVQFNGTTMVYTFNGLGTGALSVGNADSGGAGFRLLRVPN